MFSVVYLSKKGHRFTNKEFRSRREALVEALKETPKESSCRGRFKVYYYYPLFMVKRLVMAFIFVYLREEPIIQLGLLGGLSLIVSLM